MSQKPIELILMRQLASSLAMPTFLVDHDGTLVFYNEPAEHLLGMRFDETGEMPVGQWATVWQPAEADGTPRPVERLPLAITIAERRPARGDFWIHALDGTRRHIEVTALPLIRVADELVGAVAVFWELPS
ncbi:PAS domain-containing protein [Candidatus Binatia bacterium]|jgi:PAS domain S-box-containing protein|nr:PAS domain-containing protein [Candidatus Binatia bacterium]